MKHKGLSGTLMAGAVIWMAFAGFAIPVHAQSYSNSEYAQGSNSMSEEEQQRVVNAAVSIVASFGCQAWRDNAAERTRVAAEDGDLGGFIGGLFEAVVANTARDAFVQNAVAEAFPDWRQSDINALSWVVTQTMDGNFSLQGLDDRECLTAVDHLLASADTETRMTAEMVIFLGALYNAAAQASAQ